MSFRINVKTNIRINDKVYESADEMPTEIRQVYEQVMTKSNVQGDSHSRVTSKIVINGQEFDSVDEMPADIREQYEQIMMLAAKMPAGSPESVSTNGQDIVQPRYNNAVNAYPIPSSLEPTPKQVYRKIWAYFLSGAMLFVLLAVYGGALERKYAPNSSLAWLLLVPLGLILYAAYYSVRHWRCPYCGSSLPRRHWNIQEHRCLHCGRELEF